ncbi:MAG TPA: hypothetical protein VKU85_10170 [bacterium]|nr:hypothetical protein [bacterium]
MFEDSQDYTLSETRAQIRLSAYGDAGEVFVRTDVLQDHVVDGDTEVILREGFFRFTTAKDHLDVKAGRQALTWGTGDLVFVNDLFPKDWESFFAGREDQYLKAPADALRLGIFGLPFDVDVVLTPKFTPDRLPAPGERLSFYLPPMTGAPDRPEETLENGEVALRLSRYVGNTTVSLYGYRGFFKTPLGLGPAGAGSPPGVSFAPYHPELSVGGASVRGALLGGVAWAEAGYYDSREDGDGTDPLVENSSLRYLGGWEKQWLPDLNVTVQYYGEKMMDHGEYVAALPAGAPKEDELRHLWTFRVEKLLHYQLLRLSAFTFWSPTDEDGHSRFLTSYKLSDEVEVAVGANLFFGEDPTMFGQFDRNDSVFGRLRYSF